MFVKRKITKFLIYLLVTITVTNSSYSDEIDIQIISKDRDTIKARFDVVGLKKDNPYFKTFQKAEIIGNVKNVDGKIVDLEWSKIKVNNKESRLLKSLKSKVEVQSDIRDIKSGSKFSMHGDQNSIISSIKEIIIDESTQNNSKSLQKK